MAQYNNSVVTDAGVELLNKCEAGQSNMQMVAFVCGSGEYTDEEIQGIRQATGLKEQKLSFGFCSKKVDGASLRLSVNINNIGLKEGFYMREFGIYAKDMSDPDSEAILYSITLADKADYMPAENKDAPTTISLDYFTVVSNNVDIKITVDPSAFARAADLEVVRQGVATNADAIDALSQLVNGLNIPVVTNSTAATESTNMALNAVQANAAVEGTMANLIATLNSNLNSLVIWIPIDIQIDFLKPGAEVFNMIYRFDLPEGYSSCAITGYSLYGNNYTHCSVTSIRVYSNCIEYAVKNNGELETGNINLITSVMCMKSIFTN